MLRCVRGNSGAAETIALTDNRSQSTGSKSARKPGRLGTAEARLDAALGRLETAFDGLGRALAAQAEERDGGRETVSRMREENAALQQIRADVSGRLDAAVERLRRVLAH